MLTVKEIQATLKSNNYESTTFGKVTVDPCRGYGDEIEFYLLYAPGVNLCGSDKIEEVADIINNIDEIIAESDADKAKLAAYYEKNIKGKKAYCDSYKLYCFCHEEWSKALDAAKNTAIKMPTMCDIETSDEFLEAASKKFGITTEQVSETLKLSDANQFYSDWHKDLYGYRPR